jgi:hypothetical protein
MRITGWWSLKTAVKPLWSIAPTAGRRSLPGVGDPPAYPEYGNEPGVRTRAAKLKLEVIDSCRDKKAALVSYCRGQAIDLQQVLYVGNDVNDLEAMEAVGYSAAPADAHPRIRAIARSY